MSEIPQKKNTSKWWIFSTMKFNYKQHLSEWLKQFQPKKYATCTKVQILTTNSRSKSTTRCYSICFWQRLRSHPLKRQLKTFVSAERFPASTVYRLTPLNSQRLHRLHRSRTPTGNGGEGKMKKEKKHPFVCTQHTYITMQVLYFISFSRKPLPCPPSNLQQRSFLTMVLSTPTAIGNGCDGLTLPVEKHSFKLGLHKSTLTLWNFCQNGI